MFQSEVSTRRQFVALAASAAAAAVVPMYSTAGPKPAKGNAMTTSMPYLLFDGTCLEAMEFYRSIFGGELALTKVKDSAAKNQMQAFQQEKVLNAWLRGGAVEVSASDWLALNHNPKRGNMSCLFLTGGRFQDLKVLFDKLSAGAEVTNPLQQQFFGVYGALNDRFGVRWMFQTKSPD